MKVGLFFGSFNPVHIGHLAMANYFVEFSDLEQIWLVVSPQNPFKTKKNLLSEYERYQMVDMALSDDFQIRASNIEFNLPKPSYTIDTLTYLKERHKNHQFALIIGSDNLKYFHKWKNYEEIIDQYEIYVYPRSGSDPYQFSENLPLNVVKAPCIEISSSFIRNAIADGKDVRYFLPLKVYQHIKQMHLYKK